MASVVTAGQRVIPAPATEQGFEFRNAEIEGALAAALASAGS